MIWKLFAVACMTSYGFGLAGAQRDWLDLASIPIDGIATAGLVIYAFRLRRGYTRLWLPFAWLFAAWSFVSVSVGTLRGIGQGFSMIAIVAAAALLYFNWLALYRLGNFTPMREEPLKSFV